MFVLFYIRCVYKLSGDLFKQHFGLCGYLYMIIHFYFYFVNFFIIILC